MTEIPYTPEKALKTCHLSYRQLALESAQGVWAGASRVPEPTPPIPKGLVLKGPEEANDHLVGRDLRRPWQPGR